MNRIYYLLTVLIILCFQSCIKKQTPNYPATSNLIQWCGRTVEDKSGDRQLVSSASCMKFRFTGDACKVWLKNEAAGKGYNYISIVLDGIHQDRKPVRSDTFIPFEIKSVTKAPYHDVELYKETEAVNGLIVIRSIEADSLKEIPVVNRKKIEFIGNSITVGMSADASLVSCEKGMWWDQHNAYEAYGPRVARALDLDYIVTGVSGIGMYRNWNTDGPTMGDVYEQTYMDPNPRGLQWDFHQFIPDIVTICLGTNDLSDGDGVRPRLPFDSTKFINTYVSFIEKMHSHYPDARLVLLNSPIIGPSDFAMINACLTGVQHKAESSIKNIGPVSVFLFTNLQGHGCSGHPDVQDHERMAKKLEPVIKELLSKN